MYLKLSSDSASQAATAGIAIQAGGGHLEPCLKRLCSYAVVALMLLCASLWRVLISAWSGLHPCEPGARRVPLVLVWRQGAVAGCMDGDCDGDCEPYSLCNVCRARLAARFEAVAVAMAEAVAPGGVSPRRDRSRSRASGEGEVAPVPVARLLPPVPAPGAPTGRLEEEDPQYQAACARAQYFADAIEALRLVQRLMDLSPQGLREAIRILSMHRPPHRVMYLDVLHGALNRHHWDPEERGSPQRFT